MDIDLFQALIFITFWSILLSDCFMPVLLLSQDLPHPKYSNYWSWGRCLIGKSVGIRFLINKIPIINYGVSKIYKFAGWGKGATVKPPHNLINTHLSTTWKRRLQGWNKLSWIMNRPLNIIKEIPRLHSSTNKKSISKNSTMKIADCSFSSTKCRKGGKIQV